MEKAQAVEMDVLRYCGSTVFERGKGCYSVVIADLLQELMIGARLS